MDCPFCEPTREGILFVDDNWYARLDLFPVTVGHAEVVPVRHVKHYLDLDMNEWAAFLPAIKKTIGMINKEDLEARYETMMQETKFTTWYIERALRSDYLGQPFIEHNGGWNNGEAAGQTVMHCHYHIIPRWEGDVEDKVGGIRNIIPGMGNYRLH